MRSQLFFCLLFCLAGYYLRAQPFPCDGRPIVAITPSHENSRFFHLDWPEAQRPVSFHPISDGAASIVINGLGYRTTDGYLYGVHPAEHYLYRVAADGTAALLDTLALTPGYGYFAGDVTPDGRFLVLLGSRGVPPISRTLAIVDLTRPDHLVRERPLRVGGLPGEVYCADLAFSPDDGRLLGYDGHHRRLIQIDPETAELRPAAATPIAGNPSNISALLFDPFGRLYGYGGETGIRTLLQIDLADGQVQALQSGPAATGADGCSCPYTVDLQQRVAPVAAPTCSELEITLLIANRSGEVQRGITLSDTLPAGLAWGDVRRNPFPGKVRLEMDRRVLLIEELELAPGTDSLILMAMSTPDAAGQYQLQATLEGLPPHLGRHRRSGNPATAAFQDATPFTLLPADTQSLHHHLDLCPGESVELTPSVIGTSHRWDDGSSADYQTVSSAGQHRLTVTYGCQQWIETYEVRIVDFGLDLGPDQHIDLGERRRLTPNLHGNPPQHVAWSSSPEGGLSCTSCLYPDIAPTASSTYQLAVTSAEGCTLRDELAVEVTRHRNIFAPNAFSPNNDGSNDFFYLQSNQAVQLLTFQVIDRWGNLLFERSGGSSNDPMHGWDGRDRTGRIAPNGAYLYRALVRFADGTQESLAGDVVLLR